MATPPRRIVRGTTWFVTRRCSERRCFLRPSRETNAIFRYVLALAAARHAISVHAFCVLSNHVHLVVTDLDGRLPDFMRDLNSLVARAVNALIGRTEGFWSDDGSYSCVEPVAPADVLAKMAYTIVNPVAARLVAHAAEWPGVWSAPRDIGTTTFVARRPTGFFDRNGTLPASVELAPTVPPGFASGEEFRSLLDAEVKRLEREHRQAATSSGRSFLGVARVLAQSPFARPRTTEPRFRLNPRVAARDAWDRAGAILRNKAFRTEYRDALERFCAGARDVVFPAGTYLMRVMYGVQCAGAA